LATVIELNRVHYAYPDAGRVLNGVDLSLARGGATVIFGPSGSGKSTLAYLFNGLIPHFFGGRLEGAVTVDGTDTRDVTVGDLFAKVGLILQNADAQLFNSTVSADIAFGLESLGLAAIEIQDRVRRVSEALQIQSLLNRAPDTLSGGEKRLAAIASILCLDPAVVVLDEPFAGLDWIGTRIVRQLLLQIPRQGRSLIIIEHRTRPFLGDADRCLVLSDGRLRFDGPANQAVDRFEDLRLVPRYPVHSIRKPLTPAEPIIAVRDLHCRMAGREILRGISLNFHQGQTLAIVGANGAGKTTLIKHLNGLLQPASGDVLFKGRSIRTLTPLQRAASVGLCFQNPADQFFKTDVQSELLAGPGQLGRVDDAGFRRICEALQLTPLLSRSPYRLSEGEKRRVSLGAVLLMQPEVMIMDEPTAGQDGRRKEDLAAILKDIVGMGVTPIVVTHDLDFAQAVADRWIWLCGGQVAADGPPHETRRELEAFYRKQAASLPRAADQGKG
jgi:energy-coupling factor transport system ATP-binding protein